MTDRQLTILAALNLMVAVGAGAFGAHGLAHRQPRAARRLADGRAVPSDPCAGHFRDRPARRALWLAPIVGRRSGDVRRHRAFSGSLYLLALTGTHWLGAVTPLGGVAFLASWAMVALAAYRSQG